VYIPRDFAESDEARLFGFIDRVGVATVICAGPGGLCASEVPLLRQPETRRLWGHLARPNPQLQEMAAAGEVLVNFSGPSGYISPQWYSDPGLVPTWNFITVQVRGRVVLHDDPEEVLDIVRRLSAKHEAQFENPWTTDKMAPKKLEKMLSVIVGFHIEIDDLQGKFKLSQNRSEEDTRQVIAGLEAVGNLSLADAMRERE
jgi:transcriptional regulator